MKNITSHKLTIPEEQSHYDIPINNIHIGIIGVHARIGATNTALAFAKWLVDAGLSSAYIEENINNHCTTFSSDKSSMKSEDTGFGFVWEGVDIYQKFIKNEMPRLEFDKNYHFLIHDFGRAAKCIGSEIPEREEIINKMDILVLIGGYKGYEREGTLNVLGTLKSLEKLVLAMNYIHENSHELITKSFSPLMAGTIDFIEYMPDPEFPISNQKLFNNIIKNYL